MQVQHRQLAAELADLSFKPRICLRSRQLAAKVKSLQVRTEALTSAKDRKIMRVRDQRDHNELNDATFKPDLKTPCVCGKGKGLRDSSVLETAKHTLFCQNFMRACESLNKTSEVQSMSDRMKRHVGHLAAYDTNRNIRAQQRRQIIQELEDAELTFSPDINPRSKEIAEKVMRSGGKPVKPKPSLDDPKVKQHELPGHEEETFRPAINARSRALGSRAGGSGSEASSLVSGGDVHQRLYARAAVSISKRKEKIMDYTRQFVNTNVDSHGGINLGVTFHADLEATALASSSVLPTSSAYVNQVTYKPELSFILRRLQTLAEEAV